MSIAHEWFTEPAGRIGNTANTGRPGRVGSGFRGWLVLACAAAVLISGCQQWSRGVYRHWQGGTNIANPDADGGNNPGALIDEWLYTGDGFEGTFLQPNSGHARWPISQWRQEMINLRHVGFDTIIIQWSQYDDEHYVGTDGDGICLIERIVAAADEAGIDVYVGLSLRNTWWDTRNITMDLMREELARNKSIARWLYPKLQQYSSFRGWYIPHEVCDLYYTKDQRLLVLAFYKELTSFLNRMDPLKIVMASGYTDHDQASFLQFTRWYKMFLEDSGIDILIFQDGAGLSGRTDWKNILPFADILVSFRGREFSGDIWLLAEVFTQTDGPPINDRAFNADPADFARVNEQLQSLGMMGTKIVIYSYFTYMRPSAGEEEAALYEAYRQYITDKINEIIANSPASDSPPDDSPAEE